MSVSKMTPIKLFLLSFTLLTTYSNVCTQNFLANYLLPEDYETEVAPIVDGNVHVNVSMEVWTYRIVNDAHNFRAYINLCLEWNDYRVRLSNLNPQSFPNGTAASMMNANYTQLILTKFSRFWYPNVYFRNAVSSEVVTSIRPVKFLYVWPQEQRLRLCSHMRVVLLCRLNLSNFPFDQNHCYFELENAQRLRLTWLNIKTPNGNNQVRVMHRFTGYCEPSGINTFRIQQNSLQELYNNQSCVFGAMRFVRHVSYYVIRYHAPLFLCMCISCLGPWVPTYAWPGRTILAATVLLTVIRVSITGYNEVPARDVVSLYWYFWGCQFFVYMCLCEYGLALQWVQFVFEKKTAHAKNIESPDGHYFGKRGWYKRAGDKIEQYLHVLFGPVDFFFDPQGRNKVDYFSRVLIPVTMFVWVFIYLVATVSPWATKYRYF